MARGRIEFADVRSVAIDAGKRTVLIECCQFGVEILAQSFLVVTFGAGGDRDVGFETTRGCGFGDVDVAGGALRDVLFPFAAAVVNEFERDSCGGVGGDVGSSREFVTAVAVRGDGFLRFPVTRET